MRQVFGGRGLRKSYSGREVLCGVSIRVEAGRIIGLLGPSGAGKSTAFRILSGVEWPDAGTVMLGGHDITGLGIDARARLGIGYVPQAPDLFLTLSARDNLRVAIEAQPEREAMADRILSAITRAFALEPFLNKRVGALSGGQRKLVEIGFAMCAMPRFLLLDEPFSKLDPVMVDMVAGRIRTLARAGVGVLLTDHKARTAFALADQAIVIDNGATLAVGAPAELVANASVRAAFLGEAFSGSPAY